MFADLLSDEFAVPHIDETHLTEFVLSDELRAELQQMFEAEEHKYVSIGKASSVVQADAQFVFFSNAWFYLAALCRPYAGAVYQYFHFLDTTIRSNPSLMRLVKRRDFSAPDFVALFDGDAHDEAFFVRFLDGSKPFWSAKNIINGKDENATLRGSKDTFGSAMLAKLDVPNASSGYLGDIIYYLVKRPDLYDRLARELTAQQPVAGKPLPVTASATERRHGGHNLIIYGAPGTGKSHCVENDTDSVAAGKLGGKGYRYSDNLTRVVFHPEYTYYDFVGNFRPMPLYAESDKAFHKYGADEDDAVHEQPYIDYQFAAGPFTRVLVEAWNHPEQMYNLLLEELNRADAASVFGDVFQLLDRAEDGGSKYGIEPSEEWGKYLRQYIPGFQGVVKIPSNMNILATMNSSDQNVNVLDTAFKRRWKFHFTPIDYDAAPELARPVRYAGTDIAWKDFIRAINARIVSPNGLNLPEDRQIGPFFVDPHLLTEPDGRAAHDAVEKVLFYLWDDVTRNTGRQHLFGDITTMEELYREYPNRDVLGILSQLPAETAEGSTAFQQHGSWEAQAVAETHADYGTMQAEEKALHTGEDSDGRANDADSPTGDA